MAVNPFEIVKSINEKKPVENPAEYIPYLSNIAFSYSMDTVMLANEMNQYPNLPPEVQFDFMWHTVRKGRRYAKWFKETEHPHLQLVMDYFQYSKQKALQALQVLTQDNIRDMMELTDKGGR
jgi:hypothetical protein